jgi:hypothetical protein
MWPLGAFNMLELLPVPYKVENFSATAIVKTNLVQENLNVHKAQTNSNKYGMPVVVCTTLDKCMSHDLNRYDREQLLKLNMSSSKV